LIFKKKSAESLTFLKHGTSDRAEIFSPGTRNTLGYPLFFILKNIVPLMRFVVCSRYFDFFIRRERDGKKPEKSTHRKVSLVFVKIVSAQTNVPPRRNGGRLGGLL